MSAKLKRLLMVLSSWFEVFAFYISNSIIVFFFMVAFREGDEKTWLAISIPFIGVIGALAGLCYTASSQKTDRPDSMALWFSGDRFFHAFVNFLFALAFLLGSTKIPRYLLLESNGNIVEKIATTGFQLFSTIASFKAARSFIIGFHMCRKVLNCRYPTKDEKLFDDLNAID